MPVVNVLEMSLLGIRIWSGQRKTMGLLVVPAEMKCGYGLPVGWMAVGRFGVPDTFLG